MPVFKLYNRIYYERKPGFPAVGFCILRRLKIFLNRHSFGRRSCLFENTDFREELLILLRFFLVLWSGSCELHQNVRKDSVENHYFEGKYYVLVGHCYTDRLCAVSPMNVIY